MTTLPVVTGTTLPTTLCTGAGTGNTLAAAPGITLVTGGGNWATLVVGGMLGLKSGVCVLVYIYI